MVYQHKDISIIITIFVKQKRTHVRVLVRKIVALRCDLERGNFVIRRFRRYVGNFRWRATSHANASVGK
jgi:hypothetical protein